MEHTQDCAEYHREEVLIRGSANKTSHPRSAGLVPHSAAEDKANAYSFPRHLRVWMHFAHTPNLDTFLKICEANARICIQTGCQICKGYHKDDLVSGFDLTRRHVLQIDAAFRSLCFLCKDRFFTWSICIWGSHKGIKWD